VVHQSIDSCAELDESRGFTLLDESQYESLLQCLSCWQHQHQYQYSVSHQLSAAVYICVVIHCDADIPFDCDCQNIKILPSLLNELH